MPSSRNLPPTPRTPIIDMSGDKPDQVGRISRDWESWLQKLRDYITDGEFTGTNITLTSEDPGASTGPVFIANRASASPAVDDNIGTYKMRGRNDAGENIDYVQWKGVIKDETNGTEDGRFDLETYIAGSTDRRFSIGNGLFTPNASGGDKGADTINAKAVYDDGVGPLTDYVMEYVASGTINMEYWKESPWARGFFQERHRFVSDIDLVESFAMENHHLPSMPSTTLARDEKQPHGELIVRLLEALEIAQCHIFQLNRRVVALEDK